VTGRWPSRDPIGDEAFFEQLFQDMPEHHKRSADNYATRTTKKYSKTDSEEILRRVSFRQEQLGNLYAYLKNRPIFSTDYLGLICCWGCIGIPDENNPVEMFDFELGEMRTYCFYTMKCLEVGNTCDGSAYDNFVPATDFNGNPAGFATFIPAPFGNFCWPFIVRRGIYF